MPGSISENGSRMLPSVSWVICSSHASMPNSKIIFGAVTGCLVEPWNFGHPCLMEWRKGLSLLEEVSNPPDYHPQQTRLHSEASAFRSPSATSYPFLLAVPLLSPSVNVGNRELISEVFTFWLPCLQRRVKSSTVRVLGW